MTEADLDQGTQERTPSFRIVGIGASAGGLESIELLFANLPEKPGMAFVIIQHLAPDAPSLMDEILARRSRMPVAVATHSARLEVNRVYLLPPGKEMIVHRGCLLLSDKAKVAGPSFPIDRFFDSLAQDAGPRGIAVVLSGTGSDGSRGILEVKKAGGTVLVESPWTAKFDGMPLTACDTGAADDIIDAGSIGAYLSLMSSGARRSVAEREAGQPPGFSATLQSILWLLHEHTKIDFARYKTTTVTRRIERRAALLGMQGIKAYLKELRSDSTELNLLYQDLLIGVTAFFRDPSVFETLEARILPDLLDRIPEGDEVRIWIAGCATGEEAYTYAMLLEEVFERLGKHNPVKILATDIHPESLAAASSGVYSEEALEKVSPARRTRFFQKIAEGYRVVPRLRKRVVFARHDATRDTAFTKMHLVSCRNLLIYFENEAQRAVLALFHFGLVKDGILVLGIGESTGSLASEFASEDEAHKIFRKLRDVRLPQLTLPLGRLTGPPSMTGVRGSESNARLLATYDQLLERFMPPALLIDDERKLLDSFCGAERYLRLPGRRPSTDVLRLLPGSLATAVGAAIQRATADQRTTRFTGVDVELDDGAHSFTITAERLLNSRSGDNAILVTLEDEVTVERRDEKGLTDEHSAHTLSLERVDTLEGELAYTKEMLQATVEELQTSNEELQSSNEELVASNEELQSTNEELNSVNEELYTLNSEYQRKIIELHDANNEMLHLLEGADVGTLFLDRDLRIRKFTSRIASVFRIKPQDIGRDIRDFAANIRRPSLMADIVSVLDEGITFEEEVFGDDNTTFFLRLLPYRPVDPEESSARVPIEGVVLTITDITSLGQARDDLIRLGAIIKSSSDAIIGKDLNGIINSWNEGAQQLYGYSAQEAIGQHISMLAPEGAADEMDGFIDTLCNGGEVRQVEALRISKDGRPIEVSVTLSPVRDRDGTIIGAAAIARDITPLKQAQQELLAREAQNRLLLDSTAEAIYGIDMVGNCTFANPSCARMLGYDTPAELIGRNMHALIHHTCADGEPYALEKCLIYQAIREGGASHADDEVLWRANGTYFPAEYWSHPIAVGGEVTGAVVTFLDITERQLAEERMRSEARRREQFLAMLSHELRNPLAAVLNAVRLMEEAPADDRESQVQARDIVERQSRHMARLLDDLLDMGRIARGTIELRLEEIDLREPIRRAVEAVSPMYANKGARLDLLFADEPIPVRADPARLQQVVVNLLSNAAKYSPEKTTVTLRTWTAGANAVLAVRDQGSGIEKDLLPRVFDMFVQGERELHRAEGGIGVGLTLAKELIEQHGGSIRADSEGAERGSEFTISLPLQPVLGSRREENEPPAVEPSHAANRLLSIVIVEDQEDPRLALKLLLQRKGHRVVEAADGREGLRAIRSEHPDVALVDIGLPVMDGFQLAEAVRERPELGRVWLIALTGYGSEEDVKRAYAAGFDDHITKPAKPEELIQLLGSR